MTELLIAMGSAVVGFLFVDPFYDGFLAKTAFAKFFVFALGYGTLLFHLMGRMVTAPERTRGAFGEMVRDWWPLLLLMVVIITGGTYARTVEKIGQSFQGMGLGMLALPLAAVAVRCSAKPFVLMKQLAVVYIGTALTMAVLLFGTDHIFHETIFLIIPIGAYFLSARNPRAWQVILGLVLILACARSFKNTTFLMILVTLGCCAGLAMMRNGRKRLGLNAVFYLYCGTVLLLAVMGGLFLAWLDVRSQLPSGNVDYRREMYGIAWRLFLDSPIWGTGFTGSSVNYFTLYKVAQGTQNLPTHSDVLDILAQGGVLGLGLWLLTVAKIVQIGWASMKRLTDPETAHSRAWRWVFVLALVQVNAIVTYAVNPPLITPTIGFWIWGPAGVMWALYRTLVAEEPGAVRKPVFRGRVATA